jgi:hypothetical protein
MDHPQETAPWQNTRHSPPSREPAGTHIVTFRNGHGKVELRA